MDLNAFRLVPYSTHSSSIAPPLSIPGALDACGCERATASWVSVACVNKPPRSRAWDKDPVCQVLLHDAAGLRVSPAYNEAAGEWLAGSGPDTEKGFYIDCKNSYCYSLHYNHYLVAMCGVH